MKKKNLALLLIAAIMISSMSGCGTLTGDPSSTTTSNQEDSTTKSAADDQTPPREDTVKAPDSTETGLSKFENQVDVHIGMSVSPIDKTLPKGDSAEDNQYTRYLRDNYNINVIVDWTAAEGNDYDQKVSLAIASDSLPDGLLANDRTYMVKAAKSDMLYDIGSIFDQHASDQVKGIMDSTDGRARDNSSYDGKMVSLPNITVESDGIHVLQIRKDWLDECGLEVPKTLDDIENVAKVFLDKKPGGDQTIALMGPDKTTFPYCTFLRSSNNSYGFDPVFSAYDVYPGYWVKNTDGTVSYGSVDDKMKPALERLSKWYSEGVIDPEMGTRDKSGEPVTANQAGMFFGPWWALGYGNGDSFKNDPTANWQSYPVYDDQGKWNVHMKSVGTQYTLISKKASEDAVKAMITMYNALVRDEGIFDTTVAIGWYPLRNVAAAANEIEYENLELYKVLDGETQPEDYNDPLSIYKLLYQDAKKAKSVIPGYEKGRELNVADFNQENAGDFQRLYALMIGGRPYAANTPDKKVFSETYNLTDTMEKKWSNLKKMEDEIMLKIITGAAPISKFDEFVANWKSQGGDEILAEVQALK